ncbi:MAG: primosomal protein N' [Pseudomonadota bacterium]
MAKSAIPQLYLQVAVPSPLRQCFDYLPPANVPLPVPGTRVRVPFRNQTLTGLVISTSCDTSFAPEKIKTVLEVLDDEPLLDQSMLDLHRWASTYYLFPLGMTLQTSLPQAVREGKSLHAPTKLTWQLSPSGLAIDPEKMGKSEAQKQIVDYLRTYTNLNTSELSTLLGKTATPALKALLTKQLVMQVPATGSITPKPEAKQTALHLNDQQAFALQEMRQALNSYQCFLLEGITGSGKTEVYLQLISEVIASGKQVMVLVPEISLTPQTVERFRKRFSAPIVSFHSGLSNKQRLDGWLAARNGTASIIIGTRSAVFTPLPRLGLIIIDEEHDSSYKQQEGFRYSARDVAIYRASAGKFPIVLGSATPSLESLQNALSGRYKLLKLTERAGDANLPVMQILDMRLQDNNEGLSHALLQQIRQQLANNRQVLVFLNRRGFAPLLLCRDCGWIAECPRCERSYTLHQQPSCLRCHHCDSQKPLPRACPGCGSTNLAGVGLGTERTETLLQTEFPDYPIIRIDRDTTRLKGSLDQFVETINSGIPCILVGTQMLAKGHHFPRVSLVAVLDADSGLFSADFRGQENLGQLLTQVAGRAGRSEEPGKVLIQSYHPQHPVLQQLITSGYGVFARTLLEQRRAGRLPPFVYFLLIGAEATMREAPLHFLQEALKLAQDLSTHDLQYFGPMTSPLGKKAGKFRAQLILQANKRTTFQRMGQQLLAALDNLPRSKSVRWYVDVDPLDFS